MAALNHTSLAKKMSKNKSKKDKDCFSRESSISLTNTTTSSSPSSFGFTPSLSCSTSTTLSSTSAGTDTSDSSTEPSLSKSLATIGTVVAKEKQNNIGDSEKRYFGNSNMAVSLLVLIMWVKCCALALTSIGFFLVPNPPKRICKEGAICEETEYKS